MLKKTLLSLICIIAFGLRLYAQDSMSLVQCIEYALAHNTSLLKTQNDYRQAQNSYQQYRANVLPTLNGSATNNFDFGRTIDPATNQFSNQSSRTNYFSLNGDWVIFGGLQKLNQVRQYEWSKDASSRTPQKTKDDISLTIANDYLQILLLTEKEKQLENLVKNSDEQQKKTAILYENGATTLSKKYGADAQLATDQYNVVDMQNQLEKQYLGLKQYMNYDLGKTLKIQIINFSGQLHLYGVGDLDKAIKEQVDKLPAVQAARSQRESALYAWRAIKGTAYPKLSVDASLHTIFSSQYANYTTIYSVVPIGIVGTNTSDVVYGKAATGYTSKSISFSDQLSQNFGQTVGFTLNVPIFNGLQTKYNIQGAYITYQSDDLQLTDAEVKARNDIYQAYDGMKASAKKFEAGESKLKSAEALFKESENSFQAGGMSFFDYNTARTNYTNAQSDLLQAKYEYIFQTKVFEYYMGKPVAF